MMHSLTSCISYNFLDMSCNYCKQSVTEVELSFQEWIQALKPYCKNTELKKQPKKIFATITELRSLHVKIFDARGLSVKHVPHPYCIVSLNSVKACRTQAKEAPDPCWDEEFMLE